MAQRFAPCFFCWVMEENEVIAFSGNTYEMQLVHILRQFKSRESALADEGQLIPALCCCSILLDTSHYPCTVFRRTWVINMSPDGITLILD